MGREERCALCFVRRFPTRSTSRDFASLNGGYNGQGIGPDAERVYPSTQMWAKMRWFIRALPEQSNRGVKPLRVRS